MEGAGKLFANRPKRMSQYWKYICLATCLAGAGIVVTSIHRYKVVVNMPTTAEAYYLTENEQLELERSAREKDDAKAAYILGEFFIYSKSDTKAGMQWMKVAAKLGHPGAKSYLELAAKHEAPQNGNGRP